VSGTAELAGRSRLQRAFDAYRVNSSAAAVALLVVLNLVPLAGIFLGTPVGSLLVLIVGKTALDLAFHLRQHRPMQLVSETP
jgi:hypothetical protein